MNASISGMTKLFSRLPSIWNNPSFGFYHSIPSLLVRRQDRQSAVRCTALPALDAVPHLEQAFLVVIENVHGEDPIVLAVPGSIEPEERDPDA